MEAQRNKILWIQGVILFLVSILISGYSIYSGNQAVQIPLIQSLKNPNLFPNDPFVSALQYYPSPIWGLISVLSTFINLETLLLLLFLFTRALAIFASANLAISLNPDSWLAPAGAMAFIALIPSPLLGHGTLLINYFEHTSLSIAFLLIAVSAFYSKKRLTWMVFLTLGFYTNIMYGTFASIYFAAAFLIDTNYRRNWKNWIIPFLLFMVLISPLIFSTLISIETQGFDRELWITVSKIRHPYHLFPLTWEPYRFNLFLALIFLAGLTLYLIREKNSILFKHYLAWTIVAIIFLLTALSAAYLFRNPAMLSTQPARGTDLWFVFSAIAVITALSFLVESDGNDKRMYSLFYFFSVFWTWYFKSPTLIEVIFIVGTILIIWNPAWKTIFRKGDSLRLSNLVVLIVFVLGWITFSIRFYSDRVISLVDQPSSQIQEIASWAQQNTSIEDMFLIDPNWSEFRALSQRSVFVTWKDGTAILWKGNFVNEWASRIELFGFDFFKTDEVGTPDGLRYLSKLYNNLDDRQVIKLSRKYPIHYWVVQGDHPSEFPVVYQTQAYKILRLIPEGDNGS
ncbi:MAG: DUF6798 domain-containing protein [Anaerolineales bacterium]